MRSGYEYKIRDWLDANNIDYEYESTVIDYVSTVRGGVCNACGSKQVGKKRKYTPDFVITHSDFSVVYVEAKGRFTSTDRSKMRAVMKSNPSLDIRMLFQDRYGKAKEDCIRWCEKNNFEYAFGIEVPSTWL